MAKQKKTPRQRRELSKRRKVIRALYVSLAVLVIAACGFGAAAFMKAKAAWDNPAGTLDAGTDEYGYNKNIVNLVLLGTDTNTAREAEHLGVRTDTIVICAIDMEKKTVRAITIPRDTYAIINKVNNNLDVIGQGANRINAAYMLGVHGNKGMDYQNTMDALGDLFGNQKIPFKYYAAVNMDGIVPVADAVGGVPLTLDVSIPGIGQKGETVTLSGQTAEDYVRVRKGYSTLDGSDLSRAKRQQAFFLGIAKRIKEMGPLDAVPRLWGSLQQYFQTNMSMEEMLAFASILNDMDLNDIQFVMPVGTTGMLDGMSLFFPDDKQLQNLALDTWFNLPEGTELWTSSPRKTPEKIISTPTYKAYTPPPTKKPTATATPKATSTPKATEKPAATLKPTTKATVKPTEPAATATPKKTATPKPTIKATPKPTVVPTATP